jgi:hypothetical protein
MGLLTTNRKPFSLIAIRSADQSLQDAGSVVPVRTIEIQLGGGLMSPFVVRGPIRISSVIAAIGIAMSTLVLNLVMGTTAADADTMGRTL